MRREEAKPKTSASKFSVRNEMLERIAERERTWATDWGMCQHLFLLSDLGKTFYPAPPPPVEPPPLPHSDSAVSRCFDAWHSCLALWLDNTLDMGTENGRGRGRGPIAVLFEISEMFYKTFGTATTPPSWLTWLNGCHIIAVK